MIAPAMFLWGDMNQEDWQKVDFSIDAGIVKDRANSLRKAARMNRTTKQVGFLVLTVDALRLD